MKNLLKNIALGSLALLAITIATTNASEKTPVERAIQSLGEKFSKIDAQEEVKWINSLEASTIPMLDNYLENRISTISLAGSRANELRRKLINKSENALLSDYLTEESLGEFSTAPSDMLADMTLEERAKLIENLKKLNQQAIASSKDLATKNAQIARFYQKARRDLAK